MATRHRAGGLLDALERHMAHRMTSMLREVTMNDPLVMRQLAAYYRTHAPGSYYATSRTFASLDIEGIELDGIDVDAIMARPSYRRIDALLVEPQGKDGSYQRTAVEAKISRADFRRDTDEKRQAWREHTHRFYYLVPAGLIEASEVPPGCGLWECDWWDDREGERHYGVPTVRRRAVRNETPRDLFTEPFGAYLAGRASRAESQLQQDLRRQRLQNELAQATGELTYHRRMNAALQDRLREHYPTAGMFYDDLAKITEGVQR